MNNTSDTSPKIGILTHYYNSLNYGGNLQAYALCKVLSLLGYDASQITYDRSNDYPLWEASSYIIFSRPVFKAAKRCYRSLIHCPFFSPRRLSISKNIRLRKKALLDFNHNSIPHSEIIYSYHTLSDCSDNYDIFITGSDQVWHPSAVCNAYLLNFVNGQSTPKISYAASMAVDSLTDIQFARYQQSLSDYQAVSVREKNAVDILQPAVSVCVEQVLDPTLLLTADQWDDIVPEQSIEAPYLFCFFLGNNPAHRTLAEDYAKKHGLHIISLPHLPGHFRKCDERLSGTKLYDVSPPDFISLIKHSACVFTDSFHATVFSVIYQKNFFVFERSSSQSMGSRIVSLLDLFDLSERYCNTIAKASPTYIGSLQAICYGSPFPKFESMKKSSLAFLQKNLDIAIGRINQHEE